MINGQMRQALRERIKADAVQAIHGERHLKPLTRQVRRRNDQLEAKALKKRMAAEEAALELKGLRGSFIPTIPARPGRDTAQAPREDRPGGREPHYQAISFKGAQRREAARTRGIMAREKGKIEGDS